MTKRRLFRRHSLRASRPAKGKRRILKILFWGLLPFVLLVTMVWGWLIAGEWRGFIGDMPQMSGLTGSQTYLLLLHNNSELRPTGGFLTSSAVVQMNGGMPKITFFNSEQVAIPSPQVRAPEALERLLQRDPKFAGWVFRDSNFGLDFFDNAEQAIWFLEQDPKFASTEFDGVVGIDVTFLEEMVSLFGPLDMEGTSVTGDNLFAVLQSSAKNFDHYDREAWQNRKSSIAPLAHQLIKKIALSPGKWGELFDLLTKSANEKHLQFAFFDPDLHAKFREKNWTGELPDSSFWTVNMANIGGRKADRFLRSSFHSSLAIDEEGRVEETFTLHFSHQGTYNLQSDRYEAFVRVVRPEMMILMGSEGDFETAPVENARGYGTEVSFFVALLPGEHKELSLTFALGEEDRFLPGEEFRIALIKQAGTDAHEWNVTIRAENDPTFSAEGCDDVRLRENVVFCDVDLDVDTVLKFAQYADVTRPLLQFANFTSLTTAEVRFSEDIGDIALENISLTDLDDVPGQTDAIRIEQIRQDGEKVFLSFSGMTRNSGERFRLGITGLRDISGNAFAGEREGEFMITMVQR